MELPTILRSVGLPVVEVPGWRDHTAPGSFGPVGTMVHHDAIPRTWSTAARVNLCRNGRAGLSGPLCNASLLHDGTWYVISGGRANDSGYGNDYVYHRIASGLAPTGNAPLAGTMNGNPYFVDVEVANSGTGEPYPDVQIDSLVRGVAAINRANGWPANAALHHREWTARKIDMSWRGPLREYVALHMLAQGGWTPPTPPPPPVPPSHTVVAHGLHIAELRSTMAKILFTFGLDDMGRGWHRLDGTDGKPDVPFEALLATQPQGANPLRDGYWPLVEVGHQDDGGKALVAVEGGTPAGVAAIFLTVADA